MPISDRQSRRVERELTAREAALLGDARRDAEADRDDIVAQGRVAKAATLALRREVDATVTTLRTERERLGLSLADVEARSGIRRSVLSRLENDARSNPTLLTLQRYAAALGLQLRCRLEGNP